MNNRLKADSLSFKDTHMKKKAVANVIFSFFRTLKTTCLKSLGYKLLKQKPPSFTSFSCFLRWKLTNLNKTKKSTHWQMFIFLRKAFPEPSGSDQACFCTEMPTGIRCKHWHVAVIYCSETTDESLWLHLTLHSSVVLHCLNCKHWLIHSLYIGLSAQSR